MRRNFRDTTDKIEIDMKEVKEKLTSLTASAEKSTQEGQLVERATHRKKVMKSDTVFLMHDAALVHDDGNRWMSANTAYFGTLLI